MSWIFGILRKNNQVVLPKKGYYPFKSRDKFSVETKDHYFACGAGHNNSFYKYDQKIDSGWMVCGTGISYEDSAFHLMDFHDWEVFLSKKNNNIRNLNGHFIIVEWENCNLRIRNDQLGMRDMFFTQTDEYIAFSTRLDWLIPFIKESEIDFEIFSSSWLCVNPLTYDCFIKNAQRLGPGGKARFKDNNFTKSHKPWLPEYAYKIPEKNYFELISDLTTRGIKQDRKLLLGLSGGLDSRVLLSILLKQDRKKWSAYTYGDSNFPDAIVAKKLATNFGFTHSTISDLIPSPEKEIDKFTEFVLQTHTYMNGYLFYEQDHYELLNKKNLLIDGGGGGYYRRILAKALWLKGKQDIIDKNALGILKYIKNNKPRLFTYDVVEKMDYGCEQQIHSILENMPNIREIGSGNWVDLFSIYTRSANIGSTTQARLDSIISNYMPLMQPSLMLWVLSMPILYRVQNKIYKSVILRNNSMVTKQPLVKDHCIIPFTFNTYTTYVLDKIAEIFKQRRTTDYATHFLSQNKDFVLDTVESKDVREFPAYNYGYISQTVKDYYRGNTFLSKNLLWWLTFDVWRKKLQDHQMNT